MTYIGARRRKQSRGSVLALLVFAACAAAAYWALTALFPDELHQVGQWLLAKIDAPRQ